MSKKEKLILKLLSKPNDFTFDELITLLGYFDYYIKNSGKTGGSRVAFLSETDKNDYIRMHRPHPQNILKPYQVDNLIEDLRERNLL